jgi:spermidine synthase
MAASRLLHSQSDEGFLLEVIEEGGMRSLYFSGRHLQSRQWLADPPTLILPYTWYMMAFPLARPTDPARALMIGVGAGSMAHFLRRHFPDCHIDAVDVSPAILAVARDFFALREDEKLHIHCRDGGEFLRMSKQQYDLILLDAFDGEGMAADLYAAPFFALARQRLTEDGILCCNLWSNHAGKRRAVFKQLRRTFVETVFLPVPERGNTVSLSGNRALPWRGVCADYQELLQLSDRFGLDFVAMATVAGHHNGDPSGGFWRRLLNG